VPAPDRPPRGDFALVTVTHNSAAHLRGLLESAARHLPGVRTVVVDCASSDDTAAVAGAFADAVVVALGENAGFGRANNRGLAEVTEPLAVLVNPDVELLDDSLRALAAEAAVAPDRLLAPLVLYPDGTRQDTVHPVPASAADLVRAVIPGAALAAVAPPAAQWLEPWRSSAPRAVGWAVGCAIAARTDTLRRLGPFDEAIFLYGEDMELCLRAATAGVETWFWPAARICHHRAHASTVAFGGEPFERLAAARHDVVRARLGGRRAAVDDALQALTFLSRIALRSALRRPAQRERSQLRALRDVRRGGARG
jgi:N-acetylglucosaminyl-diphospho-decaprenol L-rhamnosyltransferase